MEIFSSHGSTIQIKTGQTREIGRSNGLDSSDKTISRRHISFFVPPFAINQETSLQFEVTGRNPIYVSRNNEVEIYRRFERGEMQNGDMFCVSSKNPDWYTLRAVENGGESVRRNVLESELSDNLAGGLGFKGVGDLQQEGVDLSDIDTVKEFGFLVIGHEFDSYPKKMIRDIKNWDWFLEESRKDSDDDDDDNEGRKGKGSGRRKRKKGKENGDDEEWTGESEDEKVLINKSRKAQNPKYITRSNDRGKGASKDMSKSRDNGDVDDEEMEDEDRDEEDETLGGFIVGDENLEDEEQVGDEDDKEEEEEEEEELIDEDEDDE